MAGQPSLSAKPMGMMPSACIFVARALRASKVSGTSYPFSAQRLFR